MGRFHAIAYAKPALWSKAGEIITIEHKRLEIEKSEKIYNRLLVKKRHTSLEQMRERPGCHILWYLAQFF
jgi:hypothetical protein